MALKGLTGIPNNSLHEACQHGRTKKVREIMNFPNLMDFINVGAGVFGYTPLHEATSSRKPEIIEMLLENGATVDAYSNGRYTPLHIAASIGDIKCIEMLLKYNANVKVADEFGKTPHRTAELNKRRKAARILKTAEVKNAVQNNKEFAKIIENIQPGEDVTMNCFNECLEIAVEKNYHFAAGFIVLREPENIIECFKKSFHKLESKETATMLLICIAAQKGDAEVLQLLCEDDTTSKQSRRNTLSSTVILQREYFPNKELTVDKLAEFREAVKEIDHAFPVSLACVKRQHAATKILLFNLYCSTTKKDADWHGLALSYLEDDCISDIASYKRLYLGWNQLTQLPSNMECLVNLVRLDLQRNHLKDIPSCLFRLPVLRNLNISFNDIQRIPSVDFWSTSLNILELQGNFLTTFPESTEGASLQFLNLADNKLEKVPEGVCNITTLTTLDISGNRDIRELPVQLGNLSKLIDLNFKGLSIKDPPANMQKPTKSLIAYLRARLRAAEPFYCMKLLIIGLANHGKSTLLQRLKGNTNFDLNIATQGIDIKEIRLKKNVLPHTFIPSPVFTFRVWDFAGQEDYYATHQCFLSQRSLYLLIWEATQREKGVDNLRPWLDNLATRVPGATVIIIATKMDLVPNDLYEFESHMTNYIKQLYKSKQQYLKVNLAGIEYVSSNVRYKEYSKMIENLKLKIYNVAENMKNIDEQGKPTGVKIMGEQVPQNYKILEKELHEKQKQKIANREIPILSRNEFLIIARNLNGAKDPLQEEDIPVVTRFLHNIGTILHYNDPNQDLKDMYFINPSWLCHLLAKIITVEAVHTRIQNGILKINDLRDFIIGENSMFPVNFYEKYLRLLYRFQIACQIDHDRVLVPSKLPPKPPRNYKEHHDVNLLIRQHVFTCIPFGFWERFISRLLLFMREMLVPSSEEDEEGNYRVYSNTLSHSDPENESESENDEDEGMDELDLSINQPRKTTGVVYINADAQNDHEEASPVLNRLVSLNGVQFQTNSSTSAVSTMNSDVSSTVPSIGSIYPASDSSTSFEEHSVTSSQPGTASSEDRIVSSVGSYDNKDMDPTANLLVIESTATVDPMDLCSPVDSNVSEITIMEENQNAELDGKSASLVKAPINESTTTLTVDYMDLYSPVASNVSAITIMNDNENNELDGKPASLFIAPINESTTTLEESLVFCSSATEEVHIVCDEKQESEIVETDDEAVFEDNTHGFDIPNGGEKGMTREMGDSKDVFVEHAATKEKQKSFTLPRSSQIKRERFSSIIGKSVFVQPVSNFISYLPPSDDESQKEENDSDVDEDDDYSDEDKDSGHEDGHMDFDISKRVGEYEKKRKSSKEDTEPFYEYLDIARLFDSKVLTCWKDGVIFNHPHLYFSVLKTKSRETKQDSIETKVTNSPIGRRVLGFIIDHVRTLIKEWYPGLAGNDGESPYVVQYAACPICTRMRINPPFMFNVQDAFANIYISKNGDNCLPCGRSHCPQVVDVEALCPELLFKDLTKDLQIDRKNLEFEEHDDYFLGRGAFGNVYRGNYFQPDDGSRMPVAIKIYNFDDYTLTAQDAFHDIRQEIFILSKLRDHQFIVRFVGFVIEPRLCALMELACFGNLKDAIYDEKSKIFVERFVLFRITKQIAAALDFMHRRRIIHRDIKSDNILVFSLESDAEVNVKVTDFGTANFLAPIGMKVVAGTYGFMAPEMFDYTSSDEYTTKVDVYSFAMVIYEMLAERRPFHDLQLPYQIPEALKRLERPGYKDIKQAMFGLWSLKELMLRMWQQESTRRPTANGVLKQVQESAFQLIYGKRTLEVPQNPRFLCAVPSTYELWVICDDKKGSFVSILDMDNSEVKLSLTIDGLKYGVEIFNLVHICLIDTHHVAVVMLGTGNDVVLIFSTDKQQNIVSSEEIEEDHIKVIAVHLDQVYVGLQSGRLMRVARKHFIKGKLQKEGVEINLNFRQPIQSIAFDTNNVYASIDVDLYQYPLEFAKDEKLIAKRQLHQYRRIHQMISVPTLDNTFAIFFEGIAEVHIMKSESFDLVQQINLSNTIRELNPCCESSDRRVTSICIVYDVLWVGTGSGHIFLYDIGNLECEPELLTCMKPYKMELRKLCVWKADKRSDKHGVEYLVVSTGKELNPNVFGSSDFCSLSHNDSSSDLGSPQRRSPNTVTSFDLALKDPEGKTILMWHAADAKSIRVILKDF